MKHLRLTALATALALSISAPAVAATAPVADFAPGQTLGIGVSGLSWDYGFSKASLGVQIVGRNPTGGSDNRFIGSARGVWRFANLDELQVGALAGVAFDPGVIGGRSYLVPDLGVTAAYRFVLLQFPLIARFNVSLTVDQGQNGYAYPGFASSDNSMAEVPRGNLLQRLVLGPNTAVSLAYAPDDRYQLVLGGGTIVGLRVHF